MNAYWCRMMSYFVMPEDAFYSQISPMLQKLITKIYKYDLILLFYNLYTMFLEKVGQRYHNITKLETKLYKFKYILKYFQKYCIPPLGIVHRKCNE